VIPGPFSAAVPDTVIVLLYCCPAHFHPLFSHRLPSSCLPASGLVFHLGSQVCCGRNLRPASWGCLTLVFKEVLYLRGRRVPRRNNVQAARGCRPRDARSRRCDGSEVRCYVTGQRCSNHGERQRSNASIALEKWQRPHTSITVEERERTNTSIALEERKCSDASVALEKVVLPTG